MALCVFYKHELGEAQLRFYVKDIPNWDDNAQYLSGSNLAWINQNANSINKIKADKQELIFIIEQFTNIPYHNHDEGTIWIGEMAKFIALNING